MTFLWFLVVAVVIAGARAGYRWHRDRHGIPPLDPFWTDQ